MAISYDFADIQDGSTALDIALEYGHEETAELLYAFEKSSPRQRYSSVS